MISFSFFFFFVGEKSLNVKLSEKVRSEKHWIGTQKTKRLAKKQNSQNFRLKEYMVRKE